MNDRADRRRQARADLDIVKGGVRPEAPKAHAMALMRVFHGFVERAKREASVVPIMEFVHDSMKRAQTLLRGVTVDCKEGCWFCCTRWVDAKAPEVLYIARITADRPERAAATEAASETFARLDYEQRKRAVTPCAMLVDGRCSVYDGRPLVCRAAVSRSAEICERSYLKTNEPIARPMVYGLIGGIFSIALTGALWQSGLDYRAYELTSALRIVDLDEDTERRWLEGEDVFASAGRQPTDILDDPANMALVQEAFRDSADRAA
jgi:Fe-S-cluster containining protein